MWLTLCDSDALYLDTYLIPPWATAAAAAAVGLGVDRWGWGQTKINYKAPKDCTKLRKNTKRHNIFDRDLKILDTILKYVTIVATNINLAYNIAYLILKKACINSKILLLIENY